MAQIWRRHYLALHIDGKLGAIYASAARLKTGFDSQRTLGE